MSPRLTQVGILRWNEQFEIFRYGFLDVPSIQMNKDLGERASELFGQPARRTKVYKSDPVSAEHENIGRVRVGVKNAIAEDLVVDRPKEVSRDLLEIVGLQVQSSQRFGILRSRCIANVQQRDACQHPGGQNAP